jgi:DNA-binding SARP family transcriptional activator
VAQLRVCLLGGFEVRLGEELVPFRLPKKAIGVVAHLAARAGQPVSRDRLATLLWGETGPEQARHSLRQALLSVRRCLAELGFPRAIVADGDLLCLDSTEVEVDVTAFEKLVADGGWAELERAAALYRGDFLEGLHVNEVAFEEWVSAERERLRETAVDALARLLQHQHRANALEPAIHTALRLLRLDRTQELVHRTLIRLYARQGRRAEALRQYRACVGVLRGELGIEPEPETVRLYREILQPHAPPPRAVPGA